MDALPCPVAVVGGPDGRILAVNAAWVRLLGAPDRATCLGQPLEAVVPAAGHLVQAVLRGAPAARQAAMPRAADPAGAATWWDVDVVPYPGHDGAVLVTVGDATERVLARREAEDAREALTPIGERLRLAQEATGVGTWEWNAAAGGRLSWSPGQFRLYGLNPAADAPPSVAGWMAMIHVADRALVQASLEAADAARQVEFRLRRADTAAERWLLSLGRVAALDPQGRPARVLGVSIDITERRAEQEALRRNEERLRLAAAAARVYAWDWDILNDRITWADGLEQELGLPPGGFGGSLAAFRALVHADDLPQVEASLQRALSGQTEHYRAEFRMRRADGSLRWTATQATIRRDADGRPLRIVGMDHDVTVRKQAEAALHERERQQAAVASLGQFALQGQPLPAVMQQAIRVLAETLRVELVALFELLPDGETLLLRAGMGWDAAYPVGQVAFPAGWRSQAGFTLLRDAGPVVVDDLGTEARFQGLPMLRQHGVVSGISVIVRGIDETGPPLGVLSVHTARQRRFTEHDIRFLEAVANILAAAMQREQAETALRLHQASLRAMVDAMPQLVFVTAPDGQAEYRNRRWSEYCESAHDRAPDQTAGDGWIATVHPEDRAVSLALWQRSLAAGEVYERLHRLRGRDGQYRWFLTRAVPEHAPGGAPEHAPRDGRILRWIAASTDVSALVEAREAALQRAAGLELRVVERSRALAEAADALAAEMRRRQDMQAALLQSQKLEALGQLTAGVAHDFNNVLSAILGSFDLIALRNTNPQVDEFVVHGRHAAHRAAAMIRQLLGFSRQEAQRLAVVDLAETLPETGQFIGHAIGAVISRTLDVAADVWPVLADAHQLEVALLNLAINARDAMPNGGTLTLGARNLPPPERPAALPPGDYVSVFVRDTGTGMPASVLARATEAFFTTKAPGKGTGLGLPMVQTFAERAGGCVRIHSQAGAGTRVEIILPRASVSDIRPDDARDGEAAAPPRPAAILFVEQEDQLRQIMAGYLRALGYSVTEAPNAEIALVLAHAIEVLDLLLADVTVGPAVLERLQAERPGLRALFTARDAVPPGIDPAMVLKKPFKGVDLAQAVNERLAPALAESAASPDRLVGRLRSPRLLAAYLYWRAARNGNRPPRLPDFNWGGLPQADNAFTAAVEPAENGLRFRYLQVGAALEARLGRPLRGVLTSDPGAPDQDEAALGSLDGAYRRCARTLSPSYEYASYDFGDGAPVLFERLILPVSDDGEQVTHLVGIVLFNGTARTN
nr:PAS domain-containing protein [Rhodopila globiformis]